MPRHPSRRITKRLLANLALTSVALTGLAALASCASTPAPGNAQIQGPWRLDSATSDDVPARIASAIRTAQRRRQRQRRPGEEGGAGLEGADDSGNDSGNLGVGNGRIGPDFQELRERLQQTLDSPRTLTFKVQSDDVEVGRDDLPARDYQPGDTITRFEEYGTAQLKTAWKDQAFVITERYTSGARLEERYALDLHGALVYTRSLRDPTVGRIDIRSVYRRPAP
jgi:hypothetical protein